MPSRPCFSYTEQSGTKYIFLSFRREPGRRLQLHDQLKRARRLRASLEEAADLAEMLPSVSPSSYPRAMSILQTAIPDINRLVRLTEVVRGKQTIRDPEREYDSWNEWTRIRNNMEEEQHLREQRALRQQLREFAMEKNPVIHVDEELERWHDSLITKPECDGDSSAEGGGDYDASGSETVDDSDKEYSQPAKSNSNQTHANDLPSQSLVTTNSQDKLKSDGSKEDVRKRPPEFSRSQRKRKKVVKETKTTSARSGFEEERKRPPEFAHELIPKQPQGEREGVVQEEMKASAVRTASVHQHAPAKKNPPKRKSADAVKEDTTPKKCHDCKQLTTNFRSCHYWTLTGKCKKKYCIDCLSSKYPLTMDDAKNDLDWHCPSCLGTCMCKLCVIQRQKEEERERSRNEAERKSSRRSAAGNNYSFFF